MLSRIAEALFWMGRYVERAEDTARILDVHYHILLEDPWVDEETTCSALLDVMGVSQEADTCTARTVSEVLAFDDANSTAIAGALWAARENARGVRDAISSEMWECLNATWHAVGERRALSRANPSPFFRFVKERSALFAGLADSTMSRDDGWRFLCLGTALERVDMTCRLLSARFDRRRRLRRVGHHPALLLGPRGLPAHLPAGGRHLAGRFLPPPRPALPPLRVLLAGRGRAAPGRARTGRRALRHRGRRPPGRGPGPHGAGVPPDRRVAGRLPRGAWPRSRPPERKPRRPSPPVTSTTPSPSGGSHRSHGT